MSSVTKSSTAFGKPPGRGPSITPLITIAAGSTGEDPYVPMGKGDEAVSFVVSPSRAFGPLKVQLPSTNVSPCFSELARMRAI